MDGSKKGEKSNRLRLNYDYCLLCVTMNTRTLTIDVLVSLTEIEFEAFLEGFIFRRISRSNEHPTQEVEQITA